MCSLVAEQELVLTNRRLGHPVHDNQNQRTVGRREPATLENSYLLQKIHFDRERIRSGWAAACDWSRLAVGRRNLPSAAPPLLSCGTANVKVTP
jgi:hypothetical protein